jgi:hypothetical protein
MEALNMPSSVVVYINNNEIKLNDPVKIDIIGSPNELVTLAICRRLAAENISETDPIIEEQSITLDTSGAYSIFWTPSKSLSVTGTNYRYYARVTTANQNKVTSDDIIVLDSVDYLIARIEDALGDIQTIPVYDEVSKDSINGGYTFTFTYKNWRSDFPVIVIKNGQLLTINNEYTVNRASGTVTTIGYCSPEDIIQASYCFSFFDRHTLIGFIQRSLQEINMISPVTHYNEYNYESYLEDTIIMGAALRALDSVFASSMFREKAVIFGDKDIVQGLASYYSRLGTAFDAAIKTAKKMHNVLPSAITGHDSFAPPRVLSTNFRYYAYLRGRAI